jgi:diaminopimelate epimerase
MGNPHLACLVDEPVDGVDLTTLPPVDPAMFPEGVNVEVVNVLPAAAGADLHVRMRVYERGVGETRSCGTGACAAASAALTAAGRTTGTVAVDVPGGRLTVGFDGRTTVLSGPAVVIAAGTLTAEWLAG